MGIAPIGPSGSGPVPQAVAPSAAQPGEMAFGKLIGQLVQDANAQQLQTDQAVKQLAMGEIDSLHDVMLSMAKADLSFRLILEIRNRLTEAYQEIMRMQL
ncbi:MAG: flagellar hook-basal body complex protein FliE [Planctomycetes bacterium]|nr:flagellar hook-basal body complex protein FliE [Planctomycetota bacterium]